MGQPKGCPIFNTFLRDFQICLCYNDSQMTVRGVKDEVTDKINNFIFDYGDSSNVSIRPDIRRYHAI